MTAGAPSPRPAFAARILVPLHDLSPGGGERIAIRLATRWAALGRRVTLLCGTAGGDLAPLIGSQVEVVGCDPQIERARGSRRRLGLAVARRLAEAPADLLFVAGNYHWPTIPPLVSRLGARRPAVVAQVSNPLHRPGRGRLAQAVFAAATRRRLRHADAAVTLSETATSETDRLLGRRIARRIPLPALEDDAPAPAPPRRNAAPLVLAAGRLVVQKRFDLALRAFAAASLPGARLVILGEGPERARLEALVGALGIGDRVEMPGYLPDIRPWLDACDIFLLTSAFEGYGAVVVEALAAGRPVVATACTPACDELLGVEARGRVVPVGDVPALAGAIAAVAAQPPPDPRALAAAVAGYQIGPAAQAYLDLFDAACAARAAQAAGRDRAHA